jgi:CMP/dCMP kinase
MKITIAGTLGSGKSTVGKMLAAQLKYNYYYTGDFARKMAEKKGMTLLDFNKLRETTPSLNTDLDDYQKQSGKQEDNFVLDGHLGFFFVPDSVKVFLKCSPDVAASRILKSVKEGNKQRADEGLKEDETTILETLKKRNESEQKQYSELYNIKFEDESNFDLVIDTSKIPPQEVCDRIIEFAKRKARIRKGRKRA